MSEEHYPAKSLGNNDIVAFDLGKFMHSMMSDEILNYYISPENIGKTVEQISDEYFDAELTCSMFPKGRTIRSLCRTCNTFLGKYDEAYKKFFDAEGEPSIIKGYTEATKLKIIKAILAKFISIPEGQNINFDFIEFVRNESMGEYVGEWMLFTLVRDHSTDFFNMPTLETGKIEYDEGIIFEFSDDKFIFHLMNFKPHKGKKSMNMMDILNKNYKLVKGSEIDGGYHSDLMIEHFLRGMKEQIGDKNFKMYS